MKWSPWPTGAAAQNVRLVKVNRLRLELAGFLRKGAQQRQRQHVSVEVKWKGPKPGVLRMVPFRGGWRSWRQQIFRNYTPRRRLVPLLGPKPNNGGDDDRSSAAVEWDDEFERLCSVSPKVDAWDLSFTLLYVSLH